jgi:hypothetical protein
MKDLTAVALLVALMSAIALLLPPKYDPAVWLVEWLERLRRRP